jgi:hypothetical protein
MIKHKNNIFLGSERRFCSVSAEKRTMAITQVDLFRQVKAQLQRISTLGVAGGCIRQLRSQNEAGLGFACDRGVARRQIVWPLAVCGLVTITTKDLIK